MGTFQFKPLLQGHDTIECSYYLHASGASCSLDFEWLAIERERLRDAKGRGQKQRVINLGGVEFMLAPNGTSSGYPFIIANPDWTISFGEFNSPSFYVKYRSEALWREGAQASHQKFCAWAAGLGLETIKGEGLARVDFTFDYQIPVIDFDRDSVISLSSKESNWRQDGDDQTLQYGVGDVVLRIYDKIAEIEGNSGKVWFEQLWGVFENVWRIEWQVRKEILKRFGIRSFQDLDDQQGDLLRYLAHEHDTLRIKGEDGNRSRWPLHPLWIDLQERIKAFNQIGIDRVIDDQAVLEQRRMTIAIAMYGYTKRLAAIDALLRQKKSLTIQEALQQSNYLIGQVHDGLTWGPDVSKRMDQMRLGQW